MINVEDPGGLLDTVENGGISHYQFSQWVEYYRLKRERSEEARRSRGAYNGYGAHGIRNSTHNTPYSPGMSFAQLKAQLKQLGGANVR